MTMFAVFVLSCVAHLLFLSELPRGLYTDEASIGLNAATIANQGTDEFGVAYPVFFKAFGEYKNGLYIYAASVMFFFFGVSEFTLRFTSFFFFILFQAGFTLLAHIVLRDRRVTLYAALASGFLPFFFVVSRVSFEVISHLTTMVYALLFFYLSFHRNRCKTTFLFAFFAGVCSALTLYAYSTARLLTPLFFVIIAILYVRRAYLKRLAVFYGSAVLFSLPFVIFYFGNPGALTGRFGMLTYISDASLTLFEKVQTFFLFYLSYFSPEFLLFHGDAYVRHHLGIGGELYASVFVLLCIGILGCFWGKKYRDRFFLMMLLLLLVSPIPAALTGGEHALRTMILGVLLLFFSCFGLYILMSEWTKERSDQVFGAFLLILIFESAFYVSAFFQEFPKRSPSAFGSWGYRSVVEEAILRSPNEIIVDLSGMADFHWPYQPPFVDFYRYIIPNPNNIPVNVGPAVGVPGSCVVHRAGAAVEQLPDVPFEDIRIEDGIIEARCFSEP